MGGWRGGSMLFDLELEGFGFNSNLVLSWA